MICFNRLNVIAPQNDIGKSLQIVEMAVNFNYFFIITLQRVQCSCYS